MWLYVWLHYIHSRYHSIGSSGSLQHRSDRFDILHSINITSHCTRSSDKVSLQHTFSKSCLSRHFFLTAFLDYGMPFLLLTSVVL